MDGTTIDDRQRRGIRIRGVVQGVGFRPAMFRLADGLHLGGFVRNDAEGVWLEIEGAAESVQQFLDELAGAAPPASRIDRIETRAQAPRGDHAFAIAASPEAAAAAVSTQPAAAIPCDLAPCDACMRELADPSDRRFGYPFVNCTDCGPRYTIVRDVPYDRAKTTMAPFVMCAACQREYDDPRDRRFHAEPNACPACGPTLRFEIAGVAEHTGPHALAAAVAALNAGAIVAVKGAGGYVLAIDALDESAVTRLRRHKQRRHKPFAVMGRDLAALDQVVVLTDALRDVLRSPARPVVLAPKRAIGAVAPGVAPGLADLGVYLAPTPLQHLLLARGPALQVMTSGNHADEPIARTDDEARAHLAGIVDAFLTHDREIHARADDSVVRASARGAIPMRRARGFVPDAIALPIAGPAVLAVGGHERSSVCLVRGGRAVLSPHIGDLDHPDTEAFFRESIARVRELVGSDPVAVVHDLHPDYASTRWARACGLPAIAVQHHHAHVAACLAEHGRADRVIGVAFDGTGLGDDGGLWGGEILEADLYTSRRLGHLRALALPGGEAAIHQPWRAALAALADAALPLELLAGPTADERRRVAQLLDTAHAPRATGAGRWFDAVAALLGVAHDISYDGQAPAQLEALAHPGDGIAPLAFELCTHLAAPFEIDLRPAIRELVHTYRRDARAASSLAARFHDTLAVAIRDACRHARDGGAPAIAALTGGCFQNRLLLERTAALLEADDFEVLIHRRVPPNDGGLALGQAAIATARLARSPCV